MGDYGYSPAPVARTRTKAEAERKARKYIKPGFRGIRKEKGVYQGRPYYYVAYVKK